jgi:hypothetical protein
MLAGQHGNRSRQRRLRHRRLNAIHEGTTVANAPDETNRQKPALKKLSQGRNSDHDEPTPVCWCHGGYIFCQCPQGIRGDL